MSDFRDRTDLAGYGWNDSLQLLKEASPHRDMAHGRITVTHKTRYEVISEQGFCSCELTGNMLFGRESFELPCTGDWVLFQATDTGKGIIMDMLPRQKTLYRLKTGSVSGKQALASHVDKAFIVQSLDRNFNVRRIERMMLQIPGEEIQPVLVLTKTDLGFDREEVEHALKHLSNKIAVFYTSILSPESTSRLRDSISRGETVVFTGSSGVGKSTLINKLCGEELLQTASISSSTGKGRHTSTRREMVLMKDAGVLIDTPGIKLFGVTQDDQGVLSGTMDMDRFDGKCRFRDCRHTREEGCAVIQAVENGELDRGVYENYLKLQREAWHFSASVQEKRKQEKSFSKMVREVKDKNLSRGDL
jgi:ribosome biogenesis GTPase